jgi:hypothetical protein
MKKLFNKITKLIKLRIMDAQWYDTGASSYQLFPPSFYYTHTEEEIQRITEETMEKIQLMLEEMDA